MRSVAEIDNFLIREVLGDGIGYGQTADAGVEYADGLFIVQLLYCFMVSLLYCFMVILFVSLYCLYCYLFGLWTEWELGNWEVRLKNTSH